VGEGLEKVKKCDVDNAFLKTIGTFEKSFSSHVKTLSEKSQDDEDLLFCKSIAAQMKWIPQERKGIAKCQILQMLQGFEFGTFPTTVPHSTFSVPLSTSNSSITQGEFAQYFQLFNRQVDEFPTYKKL
jgi:hypothetical protein